MENNKCSQKTGRRLNAAGRVVILAAVLLTLQVNWVFAEGNNVTVDALPKTVESYISLRDSLARTPEGGASLFLVAMMVMKENPEVGLQMMTVMLDRSLVTSGKTYLGYAPVSSVMFHIDRITREKGWSYLPAAYVAGTSPADGYRCTPPYTYQISRNAYSGEESGGTVKVFVKTYGVMPRPVTMKVNDKGIWKVAELSSLFVDVAPPASDKTDDL
ncbi:MAG TPA: hypothetical protein VMW87_01080 [Spirochaetia bacterium]|nr:hypothetical protein [Spirochaetia bacterium]